MVDITLKRRQEKIIGALAIFKTMKITLKDFIKVGKCPACSSPAHQANVVGRIFAKNFELLGARFSCSEKIQIKVRKCNWCGLYFKDLIPSKDLIRETVQKISENTWKYRDYSYDFEKNIVNSLDLPYSSALIDIGAYRGELLKKLRPFFKIFSALDIIPFPEIPNLINGEYIISFLDEEFTPQYEYDVVAMFDTFEHCYNLKRSLENCRKLLKPNGFLILETGNAGCKSVQKYGIENWYYINYFEHFLTASASNIAKILEKSGFKVKKMIYKKHKGMQEQKVSKSWKDYAKKAVWLLMGPSSYKKLGRIIRKREILPLQFNEKDHVLIIAQKE